MKFKTDLVGVIGKPVWDNPSEPMVQAAFDHHDLAWRYLTLEVAEDGLEAAVQGLRAMGFAGFNCTMPHKIAVIDHLDEIAPSASLIGAVNCVVRKGDRLIGENTDGRGLVRALQNVESPKGLNVVMLGAGGAARAIAVELALAGIRHLTVVNRDRARGEALLELLQSDELLAQTAGFSASFEPLGDQIRLPGDCDVFVNATSIGMYPNPDAVVPLDFDSLPASGLVIDVVPNPPETPLLKRAKSAGCRTIDGLDMLIEQGRYGIELWTGVCPDKEPMRSRLEQVI